LFYCADRMQQFSYKKVFIFVKEIIIVLLFGTDFRP
jgi:hypothetical protein